MSEERKSYIKTDKQGRCFQDILCTDIHNNGFCLGTIELNGKRYMLACNGKKGVRSKGKDKGSDSLFIRVTSLPKTNNNRSM